MARGGAGVTASGEREQTLASGERSKLLVAPKKAAPPPGRQVGQAFELMRLHELGSKYLHATLGNNGGVVDRKRPHEW